MTYIQCIYNTGQFWLAIGFGIVCAAIGFWGGVLVDKSYTRKLRGYDEQK